MKTRATSLLLPAVLVLVVVGLAVWVVSQLTGAQAAAERLPTIVVGLSASESSDALDAEPDAGSLVGSTSSTQAATGVTATGVMSSGSVGSDLSYGSRTTTDTLGGSTVTATSTPNEGTSPHTGVPPATAPPGMRMVVPDPLREHVREHDGGSMSTAGASATSTTSTTVTTTSGSSGMMGTTGTTGTMGH